MCTWDYEISDKVSHAYLRVKTMKSNKTMNSFPNHWPFIHQSLLQQILFFWEQIFKYYTVISLLVSEKKNQDQRLIISEWRWGAGWRVLKSTIFHQAQSSHWEIKETILSTVKKKKNMYNNTYIFKYLKYLINHGGCNDEKCN